MFTVGVDYVYIPNTRERGNQATIRDFLERSASIALRLIMRNQDCFNALSKALCVHYFLPCGSNGSIHVPQFLCPDVCSYIVDDVCRTEWPILVSEFQSGMSSERIGLDLPFCNNTSQIISYLNLSNDCCSNAGIVLPSSTPSEVTITQSTTLPDTPNIIAVIGSSVAAGSIVLLVGTLFCLIVVFLRWKRRKMVKNMVSSERYFSSIYCNYYCGLFV